MLYEYFLAKESKINDSIHILENIIGSKMSNEDLEKLKMLRLKKQIYDEIFHDLLMLIIDFPDK